MNGADTLRAIGYLHWAWGMSMILDQARRGGWSVISTDIPADTTTPVGRFLAQARAAWSELADSIGGES